MTDGEGPGAPRGPGDPTAPGDRTVSEGRRAPGPVEQPGPAGGHGGVGRLTESEILRVRLAKAEESLRQSEQRFADMVTLAPTAIVIAQDGELAAANPACIRLLGLESPSHVIGRPFSDFVHEEDRELAARFLARHLTLGVAGAARGEHDAVTVRLVGPGDYQVKVALVGMAVQHHGRPAVQFFASDVTDLEETERLLSHQALHDPLTGLPNRLLFVDRVGQALARSARAHSRVGVFFCDLDRFQVVNDGLGHAVGDRVLLMAAGRLRTSLRPSDTVARFSGDEFVVLCELSREPGDVTLVAKRLLGSMADPFEVDDTTFTMSASIGVAIAEDRFAEPEDLIRDAAAATSQAKARGRNRFEIFSPATRERALGRIHIESSLRRAMEDGHLRVYYQPMVECHTGRLVGAEALSPRQRWTLEGAALLKEAVLQQSALDPKDSYCSPQRQFALLEQVLAIYREGLGALEAGIPVQELLRMPVLADARRLKSMYGNDQTEALRQFAQSTSAEFARRVSDYAAQAKARA